jgi:hypothetical protein
MLFEKKGQGLGGDKRAGNFWVPADAFKQCASPGGGNSLDATATGAAGAVFSLISWPVSPRIITYDA